MAAAALPELAAQLHSDALSSSETDLSSASDSDASDAGARETSARRGRVAAPNAALNAGVASPAIIDLADDDHAHASPSSSESEVEVVLPALSTATTGVSAAAATTAASGRSSSEDEDDNLPIRSTRSTVSASPGPKRKRLRQSDAASSSKSNGKQRPPPPVPAAAAPPVVVVKPQPTECTICYDPCKLAGRHRLVSLKCGHVFGKKCIERWVLERKSCPNCNVAVRKADIRALFTDHVAVVDNSGVDAIMQKYEAERAKRLQSETDLSRARLQLQIAQAEAQRLQHDVAQWRQQVADLQCRAASDRFTAANSSAVELVGPGSPGSMSQAAYITPTKFPTASQSSPFSTVSGTPTAALSSHLPSSQSQAISTSWPYRLLFRYSLQSSRVFGVSDSCALLCIGEAFSPTTFGVVKLSTSDARHAVRISAHQSPVRDLSISAQADLVLSVAFDGKLVVSNLRSDSVVLQCPLPPTKRNGWSCSFSMCDPFAMYCGFHDGTVAKYDMRRPAANGSPLALFQLPMRQPVHSIQLCAPPRSTASRDAIGHEQLVAATFGGFGVWTCAALASASMGDDLPVEATTFTNAPSCCSLSSMQTDRRRLLVTTRTQSPSAPAKHSLYELPTTLAGASAPVPLLKTELTGFRTPQALSRSSIWATREGNATVASWDDEARHVTVWDAATKQTLARLAPSASAVGHAVVDVQHAVAHGDWRHSRALLGVLSPQELVLYGSTS